MNDFNKLSTEEKDFLFCFALFGDNFIPLENIFFLFQKFGTNQAEFFKLIYGLTEKGFLFNNEQSYKLNPDYKKLIFGEEKRFSLSCEAVIYSFLNLLQPPYKDFSSLYEMIFLSLIRNHKPTEHLIYAINQYVNFLKSAAKNKDAEKFARLAADYAEKLQLSPAKKIGYLKLLAEIYADNGNYDLSNEIYLELEKLIFELPKEKHGDLAIIYNALAWNFYHKKDFEKATDFILSAIKYAGDFDYSTENLTLLYVNAANFAYFANKLQRAEKLLKIAEKKYEQISDKEKFKKIKEQILSLNQLMHIRRLKDKNAKALKVMIMLILFILSVIIIILVFTKFL